jgi:hypothetical protein
MEPLHAPPTEQDVADLETRRAEMMQHLSEAYSAKLDEDMGQLHNQFVSFIATAGIPLPQVLLVLELLVAETVQQARVRYLGEG